MESKMDKDIHYDTALVGVWWGSNYGSVLNGYAVYKTLKNMDKTVLLIHKHSLIGKDDAEVTNTHNAEFIEKYYLPEEVSPIMTFNDLPTLNDYCDTFIAGSDQIWNYGINKGFKMGFMLNFVDDDHKIISFGTSFGHDKDFTPPEKLPYAKRLIHRFDDISVRERFSADVCEKIYGAKATVTAEPVFCLTKNDYEELAEKSDFEIPSEPYILSYILDPTPEKREAIKFYEKESGYKCLNIIDGAPRLYEKNSRLLGLDNILAGIGADDFVKLYSNASFIITDSFHGTAFAVIFNKPFISIKNIRRGPKRFNELLDDLHLSDRIVNDPNDIPLDKRFLEPIDYSEVDKIVAEKRNYSVKWLEEALAKPKKPKSKTIEYKISETDCMGCSACKDICPKDAISLKPDNWGYYRSSIDYSKCIACGKCIDVCPAYKLPQNDNTESPECYRFIASDKQVLRKSSSGGIFYTLAKGVISEGGAVVGAAWRDDFSVEHIIVEDMVQLEKLQKSKYLQSYSGNCLRKIKELLENKRKVLFVGTPCQVYGLKAYLGKEYDNLIAIDFLCGNSPSSMFFKKYISESFGDSIKSYEFRHKSDNHKWDSIHIMATLNDGKTITRSGPGEDYYQKVYHNHTMCPKHCENCRYQKFPRVGDLSIGDFWGISKREPGINATNGVSIILANNAKGESVISSIPPSDIGEIKQVPLSWMGGNGYSRIGGKNYCSMYRDSFYEAITKMTFSEAVEYAVDSVHEQYRDVYKNSPSLLQLDSKYMTFRYEEDVWESNFNNGFITLKVKPLRWRETGHFARLPLNGILKKGKKYRIVTRFKIKSLSNYLSLHLITSGTNKFQIIHKHNIENQNDGKTWIEIDKEIIPKADDYNEFMIGAAHLRGKGNFVTFDYINIIES